MRRQQRTNPQNVHDRPLVETSEPKLHGKGTATVRQLRNLAIKYKWYLVLIKVAVLLIAVFLSSTRKSSAPSPSTYQPRYVRFILSDEEYRTAPKISRLDLNMELYPSKRLVYMSQKDQNRLTRVRDSSIDYKYGMADEFETEECKAQYDWQKASYPTCNSLHEMDILSNLRHEGENRKHTEIHFQNRILGHGYWRDVWLMNSGVVLKTLRYEHDFEDRNYDRHRRDAVSMQHLTKSKMVVNIYSFCGNSGVYDYADGGSISDVIWPRGKNSTVPTDLQRLQLATQAAMGIAAMHNSDLEGVASMAHTDITPSQFVGIRGVYMLNDFNRVRFVRWNVSSNQPCPYTVGKNPGKNRSPEEYNRDPQTEKVDIYSLGNLLYMLLTGLWPFLENSEEEAQDQVKQGLRPSIPFEILNSTNPILQDLKEIMFKCHEQEPKKRASARQVESMLLRSLHRHDPAALARWGLVEHSPSGGSALATVG